MANNFFNDSNKAYSENLNDGILVGNAFDWTVEVSLPTDTDGVFPNSSTIVMAKVADVSITPNSNLSIGSTIENNSGGSQVYRLTVYPNFNRFGGFKSISLTADSGVTFYIANKGGTSPIASNLDYDDLGNVPELKVLKEYDIVITIPMNKEVTGLEFVFQSSGADVSGSINQANVAGLGDRLTAIESKDTQQDGRLTALEEVDDGVFFYQVYASDYSPNIDGTVTVYCKCTDIGGVGVEGKSLTLYKDDTTVGTQTTDSNGVASWNVSFSDWNNHLFRCGNANLSLKAKGYKTYSLTNGTLYYDDEKVMAVLNYHSTTTWNVNNWTTLGTIFANVPSGLRPSQIVFAITSDNRLIVRVKTDGTWEYTTGGNNVSAPYLYTTLTWFLP